MHAACMLKKEKLNFFGGMHWLDLLQKNYTSNLHFVDEQTTWRRTWGRCRG